MDRVRKAVIPAAGLGTRFLPVTKVVPKELLPIGNKPAIQYVVEEAAASGIEEIILVLSRSKMTILDYFKSELADTWPIKFTTVFQEEPLGLGHAVLCAKKEVGDEPFVVILPDVLVVGEIPACVQLIQVCKREGDWGILLEKVPREKVRKYGIVGGKRISADLMMVDRAVEKPEPDSAPSDLAILGRYLFTPGIFPLIESSEKGALGELQLTDAINALAREKQGYGIACKGEVLDVGTLEGMRRAWNRLDSTP